MGGLIFLIGIVFGLGVIFIICFTTPTSEGVYKEQEDDRVILLDSDMNLSEARQKELFYKSVQLKNEKRV